VTQHARDRPVLVDRRREGIVVQPVDELPETRALTVVDLDGRATVRHDRVLPRWNRFDRDHGQRDQIDLT